ncbi:MAG: hypothetical protein V4691_06110 [Pseudomonadota bacterium]
MSTINSAAKTGNSVANTILKINAYDSANGLESGANALRDNWGFTVRELKGYANALLKTFDKNTANDSNVVKGNKGDIISSTKRMSVDELDEIISKYTVFKKLDRPVFNTALKKNLFGYNNKTLNATDATTYLLLSFGISPEELAKGTTGKIWDTSMMFNAINPQNATLQKQIKELREIMYADSNPQKSNGTTRQRKV